MDYPKYPLKNHPQNNTHKDHSEHTKTQESFRQNFSFAEKILNVRGIFPTLSDDHDIKKVTREKVENMLYARQLIPASQQSEDYAYLGPKGINQWIWENKILREIQPTLLREYLSPRMDNAPHVFIRKYKVVRKLLISIANLQRITVTQVQNNHLLDPSNIRHGSNHLSKEDFASLFRFLMEKSVQAGILDEKLPLALTEIEQVRLHPRILSFKLFIGDKGFSRKHVQNTITHVQQLFEWLCANVRMFVGTSPDKISIFRIQNEHLLMYRTYKLKLIKEGLCSPISFTHCIYAIRSFYRFLKDRFGYEPPLQRFRSITAPRYSPREIPTDEQIESFFQVVDRYAKLPDLEQLGYRFMLHLGLRLTEVAKIKWEDINLGTRTIVIHSKGKKTHVLPLAGKLYELLQTIQCPPTTKYILGEKTSTIAGNLYEYFKLYAMLAGWTFPGGVHLLRHTFITRLANKGILPQAIKELARVSMLDTVGLYIHLVRQDQHMISQINMLKYDE